MKDQVTLRIRFRRGDRVLEYEERLDRRNLFPSNDVGSSGPFPLPNRHNLRAGLDRIRWGFEERVFSEAIRRFGSPVGIAYEPRRFRLPSSPDWHDDEGDALLYALVPRTSAEAVIEGLADADRAREQAETVR